MRPSRQLSSVRQTVLKILCCSVIVAHWNGLGSRYWSSLAKNSKSTGSNRQKGLYQITKKDSGASYFYVGWRSAGSFFRVSEIIQFSCKNSGSMICAKLYTFLNRVWSKMYWEHLCLWHRFSRQKKTFLGRFVIPVIGVEPILHRWNGILNPARLPIPPHRHNIKW